MTTASTKTASTAAATMRAAVQRRFGAPETLAVEELRRPEPSDDELLVRVHAAVVGVVDGLARQGSPAYARIHFGLLRPRFPVLGCDFAGQVEAIGPAVTRFAVGEPGDLPNHRAVTRDPDRDARDGAFHRQEGCGRLHRPAFRGGKAADLLYLAELAEASAVTPVVDSCYPLDRIADAHRRVEAGHKRGNVVVTMTAAD